MVATGLEPVAPSVKADGDIHRCTAEDLDELTEFLDAFHQEIEIDRKDAAGYRADAQAFIDSGNMFLWKNAQGIHDTNGTSDDRVEKGFVTTADLQRRKQI